MFETSLTVVGNVVNEPVRRETPSGQDVMSFRVASTARYWSGDEGRWRDGGTVYLTVSCWRRLVLGVSASVHRGDPVIVHGPIRTTRYTTRDGVERTDYEMRANAVGLDVARSIVQRVDQKRPPGERSGDVERAPSDPGAAGQPGSESAEADGAPGIADPPDSGAAEQGWWSSREAGAEQGGEGADEPDLVDA